MKYLPSSTGPAGGEIHQILGAIAVTTDLTALARCAAEAYQLSVTQERDLELMRLEYTQRAQEHEHLHAEVMLALQGAYIERARQISLVEQVSMVAIQQGHIELAHSLVTQLLKVMENSPVRDARSLRQR